MTDEHVRNIRVFVASPGDVNSERERVGRVAESINRVEGQSRGFRLEVWDWRNCATPALGSPQDLINPAVDRADIVVLILWQRFGTRTSRARSGTAEEVTRAIERWEKTGRPLLLAYFGTKPSPPPRDTRAVAQLRGVASFRAWVEKRALNAEFGSEEEFSEKLSQHLRSVVDQILTASNDKSTAIASRASRKTRAKKARTQSDERPCAIGIDIGSTKVYGCVAYLDAQGPPVARRSYVEDVSRDAQGRTTCTAVLDQVKGMIQRIRQKERLARRPFAGVGIAAPGQVNLVTGTLTFGPGLGVRNVPFRNELESLLGVPVRVDNDARCATRCELRLATGRRHRSFVCVFIGTGVGSGIVIDGKIYVGRNFCAGEVGHSKLDLNGPLCTCGQRGCLEAYVNGPAIARRAQEKAAEWRATGRMTLLGQSRYHSDARGVAMALDAGDEAAIEVARETALYLGMGVANYINILNPHAVVFGGGIMSGFFKEMSETLDSAIQENTLREVANTSIVRSKFIDSGAAIGAALLFHPQEEWPYDDAHSQ